MEFALQYSLRHKARITIIYQKDQEITQRSIKVLELDEEIVRAYCYTRRGLRVFKKENILAAFIPGGGSPGKGLNQVQIP